MADESTTLTLLKTVPGRVARDLNDWANGLKDDSAQKPVLQGLAETIEDLGNLLEPRPTGSITTVYCLRANDIVTDAVEHALNAQFPAAYRSQDMLPPVHDRDDAYYLADPRFAQLLDGIQARGEEEADTSWDAPVRRGLNRVCTGRKKGDPVRVVFEIVIEFVNKLADPSVTWPNTAVKEFVTTAKDRVRNTLAAHTALNRPPGPGADSGEDEFAGPPDEPSADTRAAVAQPAPQPPVPKSGGKGAKGQTQAGNTLDKLQGENADLRRQLNSLQGEMASRLAAAAQEKETAVNAVRDELQGKLNAMEDDRARAELAQHAPELERLKTVERKYDALLIAAQTTASPAAESDAAPSDHSALQTKLEEALAALTESDQALRAELERSSQLQAQLDVAETTIRLRTVDLDEAHQEIDGLRERLEAASAVPAATGIVHSPTAAPVIEHDTPPAPPPISPDLLTELQDLGEMVAKFGGLIVKTAQRGR